MAADNTGTQGTYTIDDLRDDTTLIRQLILAEIKIRKRLATSKPHEPQWPQKVKEAEAALAAHRRTSNYIAGTDPQKKLPSRPTQANIFEND